MRAAFLIAQRELLERRAVFPAALLAGLLPLAAPLLPGFSHQPAADVRSVFAAVFGTAALFGLGVLMGTSVIGRELAAQRLGFYFSRPLSPLAIWGGKLLGAIALVVGATLLVILPTGLAPGGFLRSYFGENAVVLPVTVGGAVVLVALAHAAGVMIRSRSPWIVLDVVALVVFGVLGLVAVKRLLVDGAIAAGTIVLVTLGVMFVLAALVAGALQVVKGRTDITRGHRALSITLWSIVLVCALLGEGYSRWVIAATPRDLVTVDDVVAASRGTWVAVAGSTRRRFDYRASFLLDTSTGAFNRTGPSSPWQGLPVAFSADGRTAFFVTAFDRRAGRPPDLVVTPLSSGKQSVIEGAGTRTWRGAILPSPDGSRVAVINDGTLSVYGSASGALLGAARLADNLVIPQARFIGRDQVRIWAMVREGAGNSARSRLSIFTFDTASRKLTTAGTVESSQRYAFPFLPTADGGTLLTQRRTPPGTVSELRDGATGDLLSTLATRPPNSSAREGELADGRIAVLEAVAGVATLKLFSSRGVPEQGIPVGRAARVQLGGEPAAGFLVVGLSPSEDWSTNPMKSFLVDLKTGRTTVIDGAGAPVIHRWGFVSGDQGLPAGSEASKLFHHNFGGLVRIDPFTNERRTIVEGLHQLPRE